MSYDDDVKSEEGRRPFATQNSTQIVRLRILSMRYLILNSDTLHSAFSQARDTLVLNHDVVSDDSGNHYILPVLLPK